MNVSELTLLVLRLGFLLLLWLFIFGIVYALRTDLFGQRARKMSTDAPNTPAPIDAFAAASVPAGGPSAGLSGLPGRPSSASATATDQPTTQAAEQATARNAGRLVITSGPKAGVEFPLTEESITIGRSNDSSLVIRDDYTSTHHARLMLWNDEWMIQDLDSTNGTFLAGRRVAIPTPVHLNTTIKIGATSFELRR